MLWFASTPSQDIIITGSGTANGINFEVKAGAIIPASNSNGNNGNNNVNGVTGIAETLNVASLHAYPNPTSGVVTVEFETAGIRNITVSDTTGKTLLRQTVNGETVRIDMSGYPAGVYLITIDKKTFKVIRN